MKNIILLFILTISTNAFARISCHDGSPITSLQKHITIQLCVDNQAEILERIVARYEKIHDMIEGDLIKSQQDRARCIKIENYALNAEKLGHKDRYKSEVGLCLSLFTERMKKYNGIVARFRKLAKEEDILKQDLEVIKTTQELLKNTIDLYKQ